MLISNPSLEVDYLFVDEAHKLSGKNSRGPFYYKVVDMLLQKEKKPHFIFASPNIPNPQVYLRLMNEAIESSDESKLATTYSPVVQIKFLMDLINNNISVYNERTKSKPTLTLEEVRAVLADKSRAGHTAEIRELLKKYGASKLSLVDPKDYESLLRETEVL